MWPGFGDNSRVLEWMYNRCDKPDAAAAVETPIGYVPDVKRGAINTTGLTITPAVMEDLLRVDPKVRR